MPYFHTFSFPAVLLATFAAGCSGSASTSDGQARSPTTTESSEGARTFEDQVRAGLALYGQHCAECHGDAGQGTPSGPAVVGDGALPLDPPAGAARTTQFRTALDVFSFASEAMPGDAPGSLEAGEMVDVLAFALSANGVALEEPLSATNAPSIVLNE